VFGTGPRRPREAATPSNGRPERPTRGIVSGRSVQRPVDLLKEWSDEERTTRSNVSRILKPEPDTEICRAVEAAKGELSICALGQYRQARQVRDSAALLPARPGAAGDDRRRVHSRPIASLGSLDAAVGEVDR